MNKNKYDKYIAELEQDNQNLKESLNKSRDSLQMEIAKAVKGESVLLNALSNYMVSLNQQITKIQQELFSNIAKVQDAALLAQSKRTDSQNKLFQKVLGITSEIEDKGEEESEEE